MNRTAEIAKAREIDTEVAILWDEYWTVATKAVDLEKAANKSEKVIGQYPAHRRDDIRSRIANQRFQAANLRVEAEPLRQAAIKFDKDNYTGWTRFYLVQHIHNSTHCSSFRPTTRIGWLPDVSGLTEAEAVAAHGETLCTICFPSAPVALTTKAADPEVCTGTRDHSQPSRTGYYRGNWATCSDCGQQITLTSTGNLRKHKKA